MVTQQNMSETECKKSQAGWRHTGLRFNYWNSEVEPTDGKLSMRFFVNYKTSRVAWKCKKELINTISEILMIIFYFYYIFHNKLI